MLRREVEIHMSTDPNEAQKSKLASLAFVQDFNLLYLPVSLNKDGPFWFILDTGAQATIIDSEVAKRARVEYQGIDGEAGGAGEATAQLSAAKNVALKVSGLTVPFEQMIVVPIGPMASPYVGRPVNGILGYDFINRYVIEIDYARRQLHLHDPRTHHYTGNGEIIPLTIRNQYPHIRAWLEMPNRTRVDADLIVDTGASNTLVLSTSFVQARALLSADFVTIADMVTGAGGPSPGVVGRIAELGFGGVRIKRPPVYFSNSKQDTLADLLGADGILGADVLRGYKVILDYTNKRMILEPDRSINEPYEEAVAGMVLKAEGADFKIIKIAAVADKSPAAQAGLFAEDQLLEIEGKPVQRFSFEELYRSLSKPKASGLLIQRGQERLWITFKPQPLP
jgi:Aspartyl protease/PDZ domain